MINYTAWPEMLAWPYLMIQGWFPYKDIAIAHNPLLIFDLVIFFKIFGVGLMQLKIYTWVLIFLNVYLTYFIGKKFWNVKTAYLSSFLYLIFCIVFEGNGLWFDLALTPFALLLYLFLREKKYLWAGVIFALGFLTKQTFIYFMIPVTYYILRTTYYKKSIPNFIFGSGIVIAIFVMILSLLGILDDYYNWAIKFGIFYLPQAVGQISLPNLKQFLFAVVPFIFLIWNLDISICLFAVVGAMGVYPRWELFHFQPALPFLAMPMSTFYFKYKNRFVVFLSLLFVFCYILLGLYRQIGNNTRFYESDVQKVVEEINKINPETLYVINYWDNIYALTNTKPPKPLIPYIPWYLDYQNNKDVILNGLKNKMPEVIVIGERDMGFVDVFDFVDKFYTCNIVEKKVELCQKN